LYCIGAGDAVRCHPTIRETLDAATHLDLNARPLGAPRQQRCVAWPGCDAMQVAYAVAEMRSVSRDSAGDRLALEDDDSLDTSPPQFDCCGEAGWPRADDDHIDFVGSAHATPIHSAIGRLEVCAASAHTFAAQ
jgi:hypothetical protein